MHYQANPDRYTHMEYRRLPGSGLKLPLLSLGLWHNFGNNACFQTMEELCWCAFNHGITHFDLANNYGPDPGQAEINFGKILKNGLGAYRDELIISTKAGYDMWPGPYGSGGSRKYLMASLDQSLQRMGLDYVDIFYHHRPDPDTPPQETALALADIVRQKKALYIGLSNYDGEQLMEMSRLLDQLQVPFVIAQNRYSILDRHVEKNGTLHAAQTLPKGLICFSPLAQGQLAGRYLQGIPQDSRMAHDPRFLKSSILTPARQKALSGLHQLAQQNGYTLSQMALQWLAQKPEVSSILIGASRPEQILQNLEILQLPALSPETLAEIDALCQDEIVWNR